MYKLLGFPLNYSLSAQIHQLFAKQFNLQIDYKIQSVPPEQFTQYLHACIQNGGKGLNITNPYKEIAAKLIKNLTPVAQYVQAVNTITIQTNGTLHGANTDGIGLSRDLMQQQISLKQRDLLILGAGGAVRGILPNLIALQPSSITLVNRTISKAKLLAEIFANSQCAIHVKTIAELPALFPHVILHAISSITPQEADVLYANLNFKNTVCYDLNYGIKSEPFLQAAINHGVTKAVDGLGMLVQQAAESFYLWHGVYPNTDIAYKIVRGGL